MSNKKNTKGFIFNLALIAIVLAAIVYIVVSGSMPEASDIPEDLSAKNEVVEVETEENAETEAEVEAEVETETDAE